MATPLKIKDGSGNIQEMTTSDENYVAYQIGLHLAASDSAGDYGSLNTNSSFTSVGTFTNTFFNEPVGTAPSTSITSGSTTSTIYQNQEQNALETDSDTLSPLMWVDSSGQTGFKQMPDLDLNDAVDKYLSTIFTNDYPGSYRLASTAPSGDYAVHLPNVFTDTRTDGTSVTYNIYQRNTMTAPAAVSPIYVEDSAGGTGLKLKPMTDRQIKYSFGQRAKNRVGGSKIGSYQLRSSAQGAPTDPGTWVARGSADDTKQTTTDVSYTRSFEANYEATYVKDYSIDYSNTFSALYVGGRDVYYQRRFTSYYTTLTAVGQGYVNDIQYSRTFLLQYNGLYKFGPASPELGGYEGVGVNYERETEYFQVINLFKRYTSGVAIYAVWFDPYVPDFATYGNSYTGLYARFDSLYDGLKVQYTREGAKYDSGADYSVVVGTAAYQSTFFTADYENLYTGFAAYTSVFSNNKYGDSKSYVSGQPYDRGYLSGPGQDASFNGYLGGYDSLYGVRIYNGTLYEEFAATGYLSPAYGLSEGFFNGVRKDLGFGGYYVAPINYYNRVYTTGDDGGAINYDRDGEGAGYVPSYTGPATFGTYEGVTDYVSPPYSGSQNYYTATGPLYTSVYLGLQIYAEQYDQVYQGTYTGPNVVQYSVVGSIYSRGAISYAGYTRATNFVTARQYTAGDLYLPGGTQIVEPGVSMPDEGYVVGGFVGTRSSYNTFSPAIYASVPSYNITYSGPSLTFSTDGLFYVRFARYNKEYVPLGPNDGYTGLGGFYEQTEFYVTPTLGREFYTSGIGDSYNVQTYLSGYTGASYSGYDRINLEYTGGTYSRFAWYNNLGSTYEAGLFDTAGYYGNQFYSNTVDGESYLSSLVQGNYENQAGNIYAGPNVYETSAGYVRTRGEPYGLTAYAGGTEGGEQYIRTIGYTRRYITVANYTNAYQGTYQFPLQFYAAYTRITGPIYDTSNTFTIDAPYDGPRYTLAYDVDPPFSTPYNRDTYSGSAYADAFGGLGYLNNYESASTLYAGSPGQYGTAYLGFPNYQADYTGPGTLYYAGPGTQSLIYLGDANYTGVNTVSYVLTGDVQTYQGAPSVDYTGPGVYTGSYEIAYVKDILYTRTPTYLKGYTGLGATQAYYVPPTVYYADGPYTGITTLQYNTGYYIGGYESGAPGQYVKASYAGGNYVGPGLQTYVRAYSVTGAVATYSGGNYARLIAFYAGSGRNAFYVRAYQNTGATVSYSGGNYGRIIANRNTYIRNYTAGPYTGDTSFYEIFFIAYYTRENPTQYSGLSYARVLSYSGPQQTVYNRNYTEGPYIGPNTAYIRRYTSPTATYLLTPGFYGSVFYVGGGYDGQYLLYAGNYFYTADYNINYSGPAETYAGAQNYAGIGYLGTLDVPPEQYVGPIIRYIPCGSPYYISTYGGPIVGQVYYDGPTYVTPVQNYQANYVGAQADAPVAYSLSPGYASGIITNYYTPEYTGYLPAGQYLLSYTGTTYTSIYSDLTPAQDYTGTFFERQYVRGNLGDFVYVGSYTGASLFEAANQATAGGFTPPDNYYGVLYAGPEAVFTSRYEPGDVYSRRFSPPDYTGEFGTIENTFVGGFSSQYGRNYSSAYILQFLASYQNDYSTIYTTTYESTYLTDYLNEYTGSFEGETIEATDEIIETYTLYVRIA